MSNGIKEQQLGMSLGKANNILRKSIMFNLLERLGEAYCFKCRRSIDTVDELSIEHKIPWLYNDIFLYWDLDNIAFSHIKCNKTDRPYTGPSKLRKIGPKGTSWCVTHQEFLPNEKFGKNTRHWNGLHPYCKECRPSTR